MKEFKRFLEQLFWIPAARWAGRRGRNYVGRQRRRLKRSRYTRFFLQRQKGIGRLVKRRRKGFGHLLRRTRRRLK